MFFIDAHEDIAYNALEWKRDIRIPVYKAREREARDQPGYSDPEAAGGIIMSGLPELRRAGFGLVFGTLFANPWRPNKRYERTQTYRTTDEAYQVAQQQLAYYHEVAQEPGVSLILTQTDLANLLLAWTQTSNDDQQRPFGIVPLMEGADPIRTPNDVEQWFTDGLRIVGLSWNVGTRYAGGNAISGPLTALGKQLLIEMEHVGMILDTTHLAEESFWQVLKQFHGLIIASHSNCRALVPGARHLSDDMIHTLAERSGVIGISPANSFLVPDWSHANGIPVKLEKMVHHIDHICQITGNALHVGIGSDIDGGFGRDETPMELDTVADLSKLKTMLSGKGYSEENISNIMGGNWFRVLERTLPM